MKVLVISGFLGAGKTTFLKELARRTRRDFAVMENEYGEVGIDGAVLEQSSEKLNIWELTEGCICCSQKSDFAASLLTIGGTLDPEYLIVEPTGVGMLSQVLRNIQQIQYEKIQILSPVTLVDGRSFSRCCREYGEIYLDQIQNAGTILITRMESASQEEISLLASQLRNLAPQAEVPMNHYRQQEDDWFSSLLQKGLQGEILTPSPEEPDLETLSLTEIHLDCPNQLLLFLNGIVSGVFGSICRSKGCLQAGSCWLRFDTVDRQYSITGCEPLEESRAVFIGRDLKRSWLREILQQDILVTAYASSPLRRSRR